MSLNLSKTFGLIRPMTRSLLLSTSTLTRFGINGVEAALALDFIGGEYRTANTSTTFADAFTGTSPKLTYSTAAGSNSTMVNSAGNIVWAPHNLLDYSEDFSQWTASNGTLTSTDVSTPVAPDGSITADEFTSSSAYGSVQRIVTNLRVGASYTFSAWVQKGTATNEWSIYDASNGVVLDTTTSASNGAWEKLQGTFTADASTKVLRLQDRTGVASTGTVYIWGAHVYRSDLGGMHPVPGAATGFETYVPTNGSAEYLPRVGHHVYNGTAWVNEGLLIESEPRTNLLAYSTDPTDASWFKGDTDTLAIDATGPDGATSAVTFADSGATGTGSPRVAKLSQPVAASTPHTFSVFAKADQLSWIALRTNGFTTPTNGYTYFDLSSGAVGTVHSDHRADIQDFGNGWYRCWITFTTDGTDSTGELYVHLADGDSDHTVDLDGTSSVLIYGAQFEQASTPSSYMPTSGGTYTRTAQSLTVPPAEFGWPEPEYIGPNLVDNSEFDTDTTGWSGVNSTLSVVDQRLRVTNTGAFGQARSAAQTVEVGKVYQVTAKLVDRPAVANVPQVMVGTSSGGTQYLTLNGSIGATSFDFSGVFVATTTSVYISLLTPESTDYADWDNVSVREINPLSVSIQMDGRMTYADTSQYSEVWFTRWYNGGTINFLYQRLGTNSTNTGRPTFDQRGISDVSGKTVTGDGSAYTPGINVPYNISSRHGSTFIRGATDGVLTNLDTTPKALPDLSSTNLQIAYDFMGTIGTFRQFAGDIGDAGLVTATNPSTEPTLSLTFDGTNGSYYNLSWSE